MTSGEKLLAGSQEIIDVTVVQQEETLLEISQVIKSEPDVADVPLAALLDAQEDEEDTEYLYSETRDLPFGYITDDEQDYCFRPLDELDSSHPANINNMGHLELLPMEASIACPICKVCVQDIPESSRNEHVHECMKQATVPLEEPAQPPPKRAKPEPKLQKPKIFNAYSNKAIKQAQTKEILPPTNLTPSTRKKYSIPEVKILTFPVSPDKTYSVSMDAFNYAPQSDIKLYFLSHFHSDHYGGISKKWCYTRLFESVEDFDDESRYRPLIYCSEITGRLLTIKFNIDPRFIQPLKYDTRYLVHRFGSDDIIKTTESSDRVPGLYVTPMSANHCPGSFIFLFESIGEHVPDHRIVHCGDFRVSKEMITHPCLMPFNLPNPQAKIDKIYLDTTYLSFKYTFPNQEVVCSEAAQMFSDLVTEGNSSILSRWFGVTKQLRITDFLAAKKRQSKKKFLILVGSYLIGKERLAIAIAKKLGCPIFISNIGSREDKPRVVQAFEDEYLNHNMTNNHRGEPTHSCLVHLVPMSIVSSVDELSKYFYHNKYFEDFERCVGLRPTGWSFANKFDTADSLSQLELTSAFSIAETTTFLQAIGDICASQTEFNYQDHILTQPQRKTNNPEKDVLRIYSLPYSEHSSYRELAYFCIFLNVAQIIPTVNLHTEREIQKMATHISFWEKCRQIKLGQYEHRDRDTHAIEKIKDLSINDF